MPEGHRAGRRGVTPHTCGALCRQERGYTSHLWDTVQAGEGLHRHTCGALCREERGYTVTPAGHCAGRRGVTPSHLFGTVQAGAPL